MEIREIITNLEKAVQRRDQRESARLARLAIQTDEHAAWRALKTLASSQTAVQDRETTVAVKALSDTYLEDKNPLFAVKAALIIAYYRCEPGAAAPAFAAA